MDELDLHHGMGGGDPDFDPDILVDLIECAECDLGWPDYKLDPEGLCPECDPKETTC